MYCPTPAVGRVVTHPFNVPPLNTPVANVYVNVPDKAFVGATVALVCKK